MFAASGTSGGALGITGYSTRFDSDAVRVEKGDLAWPRQQFEGDHLARTLAGMFVYDLPNVFVNIGRYDRARALEESWTDENPQLDRPFAWGAQPDRGGPEIILNGTTTNGCRVTISALKLGAPGRSACAGENATVSPGALDAAELLCGAEIKRKTAVLLSARFTYVSPSAGSRAAATGPRSAWSTAGTPRTTAPSPSWTSTPAASNRRSARTTPPIPGPASSPCTCTSRTAIR
ncbi:hypothetical protein [Streptomyces sp. NPDC058401]|uniref:hypothetical protein n=1 Tax=Streptomyces sp. NPDC058401 TaxID=3346480 RepID=UPI00364F3067